MNRPVRLAVLSTVALVCVSACNSRPDKASRSQPPVAPSTQVQESAVRKVDAAGARLFLDTWIAAQNSADFAAYQTLYASNFTGTKRVQGSVTHFDRDQWLSDRKTMFARAAKVSVSDVRTFERDDTIQLLFQQRWASSTFADVGAKILSLEKTEDGYRIRREEMLDSKLDKNSMASPCAKAHDTMRVGTKGVRRFADIGSRESAGGKAIALVEVTSQEDANRRAPDGFAWELWTVATDGVWLAAEMFLTSPSGDWVRYSSHCFRADGSLAELVDRHSTFYSVDGLVSDTVTLAFAPDGTLITRTHDAYLVESGKAPTPGSYMRPDPIMVMNVQALPFKLDE